MAKKQTTNPFIPNPIPNPLVPTPQPVTPVPPGFYDNTKKPIETNKVFRNENGRPSGIEVNGRTFLGLSPDDVERIAQGEQAKKGGAATQQFEAEAKQRAIQAQQAEVQLQNQDLARQAQETPTVTEQDIANAVPQENLLEQGSAIGAGVATGIGGGILIGAKAGALGGSFAGPLGTAIGAVGGAVLGIGAYYSKVAWDKKGDVKQAKKVATIANKNFGQTIDALNAGIITPEVALKRWKRDQIALYAARANLKKDTDSNLDRFLSGGADELADTEGYIQDLEDIYQIEFNAALLMPDPKKIKYSYAQNVEEE